MCLLLILDVCLFNVIKIWFELKKNNNNNWYIYYKKITFNLHTIIFGLFLSILIYLNIGEMVENLLQYI